MRPKLTELQGKIKNKKIYFEKYKKFLKTLT